MKERKEWKVNMESIGGGEEEKTREDQGERKGALIFSSVNGQGYRQGTQAGDVGEDKGRACSIQAKISALSLWFQSRFPFHTMFIKTSQRGCQNHKD